MEMEKGKTYRFKYGDYPNLTYIGFNWSGNGYWHQFSKVGESKIWSELKDSDLHLIEKVEETE